VPERPSSTSGSGPPGLDPANLPTARDEGIQKVEWDLDPNWVTSTLSGLATGLSYIGRAKTASGAPVEPSGTMAVVGGVSGFIGLITASGRGKVGPGLSVLQNVAGLGSRLAQVGSRAPVSVLAARLGAASALLTVGSTWWGAFSGGGAAIQAGVEQREGEGKRDGFLRGFAAGLIGMDRESIRWKLDLAPGSAAGPESQERAADAYRDAYNASIWAGYDAAHRLSNAEAIAIVSEADRYATERDVYLSPSRDAEVALVDALVRVLPLLTDEIRAGTWQATSEQLHAAEEAQALEDAAYPTSDAAPPAEQMQALDDALYPASVPDSLSEQEMSAPATADETPASEQAPLTDPDDVPTPTADEAATTAEAPPAPAPEAPPSAGDGEYPVSELEEAPAPSGEEPSSSDGDDVPPAAAEVPAAASEASASESASTPEAASVEAQVPTEVAATTSESYPVSEAGDADLVSEPDDDYPVSDGEEEPVAEEQPVDSGESAQADGGGDGG
jgi:hypothetical protein